MSDKFQRARQVPASRVAQDFGWPLQSRGKRLWTRCQFHDDRTPSLMFDEAGRWHCYACGAGGDAVDFVARVRGISLMEALRCLDAMYGLRLFDEKPDVAEIRRRAQTAQAERDKVDAFEAWALWAGNVLAAYLRMLDGLRWSLEPQGPNDELPPIIGWIYQELARWEALYLGTFVSGGFRERVELYKTYREEVDAIGQVLDSFGQSQAA